MVIKIEVADELCVLVVYLINTYIHKYTNLFIYECMYQFYIIFVKNFIFF